MDIIEATKKALEENKSITTPEDKERGIVFVPTNSGPLGVLVVETEPHLKKEAEVYKKISKPSRYWNPTGSDILRGDWELF